MPPQNELSHLPDPHSFLINQIANGLSTTTELIQGLSSELRDNTISLATLRAELTGVTDDVNNLTKILKDGNGSQPVLSRIAVLEKTCNQTETAVASMSTEITELKNSLNILTEKFNASIEEKKKSSETSNQNKQILVAVITSIIAFIASIVAAIIG